MKEYFPSVNVNNVYEDILIQSDHAQNRYLTTNKCYINYATKCNGKAAGSCGMLEPSAGHMNIQRQIYCEIMTT